MPRSKHRRKKGVGKANRRPGQLKKELTPPGGWWEPKSWLDQTDIDRVDPGDAAHGLSVKRI